MSVSASRFRTRTVRAGLHPDPVTGAILTPIHQTTTYVQERVGVDKGFTYSRTGNPTVAALERHLGALEDAPAAICFASGMAAITTLLLTTLRAGDRILVSDVVYGGTVRLLRTVLQRFGVEATFVDTSDLQALAQSLAAPPRLVFIETPANPTLKLTDIAAVARLTHAAGALLAVDNTFLTPALQRPLDLGADIAVYSTTKYLEGHNATIGGSLVTRDERLLEQLRLVRGTLGCSQSPFEAWLTVRGTKTLDLRMAQHCANAQQVAEFLAARGDVSRVLYPGLPSFPQYELARRQQSGAGGLVVFELEGGGGRRFLQSLQLCSLAENLGAVETLVTHPATMTHAALTADERQRHGITDGLVRLSVGLEDPVDIIDDLAQALAAIGGDR